MRIIIMGGNKTVYFLAREFIRQHFDVVIINHDETYAKEFARKTRATVVLGDGTDPQMLAEAQARECDVFLAMTNKDQDNLVACQIAKNNYQIPRTIAVVNDPDNERVFKELGIDIAFSATRVIGSIIAQETTFDTIKAMIPVAQGNVNLTEIAIEKSSPAIGQTLAEIDLSEDIVVACVIRDGHVVIPRGSTELRLNDHLLLISENDETMPDLDCFIKEKKVFDL
ncbi:MAG: TrkA family potassium uptake protein [Chloroflexota bacterium]